MLAARVREKHLVPREITDPEVTAALQATPAQPAQPRLRLAFLRHKAETAGSIDAAVAKLEEARTAWLALPEEARSKGFGTLAVQYSDDPDTRYQGGEAGWITSGERHVLLPQEATAAAAALNTAGMVPEILRASGAAWLVLVMETGTQSKPGATPEAIRARLQAEHETAARQTLVQRALQASPVRILKPQPQEAARPPQPAIPSGP
jgi:PPIC-type PPIASE domain